MMQIFLNKHAIGPVLTANHSETVRYITEHTGLAANAFYLEQCGRLCQDHVDVQQNVHCVLRICGGKGGFGSMLRAIGAQIEKTTNREACRDLSGRRLRDINEEKRLKAWLDKQGEREREAEERKKRKIEKLLAVPKHEFKDAEYEEARAKLTEKVNDAVEEGFKKTQAQAKSISERKSEDGNVNLKRKAPTASAVPAKKKAGLWLGDDISEDDSSDEDASSDDETKKVHTKK